jgi:hypothetical protein
MRLGSIGLLVNTSSFVQNLDSNSVFPLILFLNARRKDELKLTLIIHFQVVVLIHQYSRKSLIRLFALH